uniref:NADH-ubiquinone oxidoreductase chain 5 n=1 Tax=Orseolia oryzae TaxID=33408 RepID=A0A0K0M771_9DIPT|nr:NADH dehydrogenase subunit 5 [Orseolia oryzae]
MYFYNKFFFLEFFFMFFFYFLFKDLIFIFEWEIMNYNSCMLVINFLFDWMSLLFMSFVLFISSMVIFYSIDYMNFAVNKIRFIILVVLFIMSMMFLIISPNFFSILLGWDGLGLVSYCLVIYFQNYKSYNAGMLTALSNRIGDVALLMCIFWMFDIGSWSFFYYLDFMNLNNFFILMLILASLTKSAQIPFSSWLPAAMAAPTPVSALVHSSTLVTAGVYLLIRFNSFLFYNIFYLNLLLLIGSLTMFMSGLAANYEMDLKKVIALSTLSQLGLMMSIFSLGFMKLAFFHLLMHALFKALLFLCAGIIIHSMMNFQDIRFSGGLNNQLILTFIFFNISSLALCGMPFLAGFYSKDLILEFVLISNLNILIFFFFFSTGLTVIYSFRLINFCLENFLGFMILSMMENKIMLFPMFFLMMFSIFSGSLFSWLIFPYFNLILLNFYLKFFTIFICFFSFNYWFYFLILVYFILNFYLNKIIFIDFFSFMWFMFFIFGYYFNFFILKFINKYKLIIDLGWIEFLSGIYFLNMFFFLKKMFLFFFSFKNMFLMFLMIILFFFFILLYVSF